MQMVDDTAAPAAPGIRNVKEGTVLRDEYGKWIVEKIYKRMVLAHSEDGTDRRGFSYGDLLTLPTSKEGGFSLAAKLGGTVRFR